MDENLKKTIRSVKKLQKLNLLFIEDSINLKVEPNYQLLAFIIGELDLIMSEEKYDEIKDDRELLLKELTISSFDENELVSEWDIEFRKQIIERFTDIREPVLIDDIYVFIIEGDKLIKVYMKALEQIETGKFKNYIF